MRRIWLILPTVLAIAACNLTSSPPTMIPSPPPSLQDSPALITSVTPATIAATPTLLPIPNPPTIGVSVTSAPILGALCPVYTTYSGARSDNKLSLRSAPSAGATQVFRVPNQVEVLLVPGSSEVEAEGYHWLNVIFVESTQTRYVGWIARDSYQLNGVRDPSISTLRPAGTQSPC